MTTFVKIKALRETLFDSETKLADFTLNSPNAIRDLSSAELAKLVGVSQSSVVKFSQKLGYKGYPAFKMGVIDALNRDAHDAPIHSKVTLSDSLEQISSKLLESKMAVLTETKNLNESADYEKTVEMLCQAKRILIVGLGGSALVGKDFSYKLQKLGMAAIAEPDGHAQLAYVATFGKDDLVIAISESGHTLEVVKAVEYAAQNGCPVVSITQYAKNPVSAHAAVKLYSVAERESVRLSSILARTAQEFVIDILFIAITQSSRPGRKMLEKTNAAVSEFRRSS